MEHDQTLLYRLRVQSQRNQKQKPKYFGGEANPDNQKHPLYFRSFHDNKSRKGLALHCPVLALQPLGGSGCILVAAFACWEPAWQTNEDDRDRNVKHIFQRCKENRKSKPWAAQAFEQKLDQAKLETYFWCHKGTRTSTSTRSKRRPSIRKRLGPRTSSGS